MGTGKLLDDLRDAESALQRDIEELRRDLIAKGEALSSLQQSIRVLGEARGIEREQSVVVPAPAGPAVRRSRPSLSRRAGHYDHILYNGQLREDVAEFLDRIGVPHYFSGVPGMTGRGDESQRQILAWARKNPNEARKVLLVGADGSQTSLWQFMLQMGWV